VKAKISPLDELCLALALDSFKATGEYKIQLNDWDTKPAWSKTFSNFRPFMLKAYAKHSKPNNSTAKSAGFVITNAARARFPMMKPSPTSEPNKKQKQHGPLQKLPRACKKGMTTKSKRW
jgi:hypothetical protein